MIHLLLNLTMHLLFFFIFDWLIFCHMIINRIQAHSLFFYTVKFLWRLPKQHTTFVYILYNLLIFIISHCKQWLLFTFKTN